MRVLIVTPAPRADRSGNRTTAVRWAGLLRSLDHRVQLQQEYAGEECDAMIALHARKSHGSLLRLRDRAPRTALIVALTGTDIYGAVDPQTLRSLELADRIVTLQPLALERLAPELRTKARAIVQSATSVVPRPSDPPIIAVVSHLRPIKDPFRAAEAARLLPSHSRLSISHAGAALDPDLALHARREMSENRRYRWLGSISRPKVRELVSQSRALVLSSPAEGGANVVCEAIASGVPVLGSRIEGTIGQLGEDYPAYFAPGDTEALAELMLRVERDPSLFADRVAELAPLFTRERERALWVHFGRRC